MHGSQNECDDCLLRFDSPQALRNHKDKFCVQSKYSDIATLERQFAKISAGKDISLYGRISLAQKTPVYPPTQSPSQMQPNFDHEYGKLMKEIAENETLRAKMTREKDEAFWQLKRLQQAEKEILVEDKRNELEEVIRKRNQLAKEQDLLEKELKSFDERRYTSAKSVVKRPDEDFVYQEGREAGKLAMHRRILEEKKREIQQGIVSKKRQENKLAKELGQSSFSEYSPLPRQQSHPTYNTPSSVNNTNKKEMEFSQAPPNTRLQKSLAISTMRIQEKESRVSERATALQAELFAGNQATLLESVNPKNKSEEDIFIESLVAQEYDALNLLAKLPRDSQIYNIKLKQYKQMSKIRQDLKDKLHFRRLENVKQSFILEKQAVQTEQANRVWLDINRKEMLNKQVNVLNQHHLRKPTEAPEPPGPLSYPTLMNSYQNGPPEEVAQMYPYQPPPPQDQSMWGYRIELRTLSNYKRSKPIKIKLILREDVNPQGLLYEFQSQYHDQYAPKTERDPYQPGFKNKLARSGAIEYNEQFLIRQNLQTTFNENQREMYLFVMALEKDEANMNHEPSLYGWYCLKLTHFGQIREGLFTLNLCGDSSPYPKPSDMNRAGNKLKEEVTIQLGQVVLENIKPFSKKSQAEKGVTGVVTLPISGQSIRSQAASRSPSTPISIASKRSVQKQKKSSNFMKIMYFHKEDRLEEVKAQGFFMNSSPVGFRSVANGEQFPFFFSIHSLRTMPSYMSPVRLQVKFLDCDGQLVFPQDCIMCDLSSDISNPTFNYQKEMNTGSLPRSTTVIIKILVVSTLNYEISMLGYAGIHLFYDAAGRPILTQQNPECFLLNQNMQLHILWGPPTVKSLKSNLSDYPTLPCTSILLACQSDGSPPPAYEALSYNTSMFDVILTDIELFAMQSKREFQPGLIYGQGYLKFKGISKEYTESMLMKFLEQNLAFNNENCSNLNRLNSITDYNASFGIYLILEKLDISFEGKTYLYFCSICKCPPATYYAGKKNDLTLIYKLDTKESTTAELFFDNSLSLQFAIPYDPNVSVIIEVNRVGLDSDLQLQSRIESCGYVVVPLFDLKANVPCANIQSYPHKLISSTFDKKNLKSMKTNLNAFLEQEVHKERSEMTLSVCILNRYFLNQYKPPARIKEAPLYQNYFKGVNKFEATMAKLQNFLKRAYAS